MTRRLVAAVLAALASALVLAAPASANPDVPWEHGPCDSGDGTHVVMKRWQGTVFVCEPPGFWHKLGQF